MYQTDALHAGWNGEAIGPEVTAGLMYEHLYRRAATIYGGSSEIQKEHHRQRRTRALRTTASKRIATEMPGFDSDERQLLDQSLQDFFTDTYDFEAFKKHMRAEDGPGFNRAAWSQYAEQGWLGVRLPESAGGIGGGMTELGIVLAAGGRHLALEPFIGTLVTGADGDLKGRHH